MRIITCILFLVPFFSLAQNYPAKIYDLIDLSGYFTTDNNSGWNFFDSQKYLSPPAADPKNGVTRDTTSANDPRHGWSATKGSPERAYGMYGFGENNNGVKYPMTTPTGSRCRFIIDLAGLKDFRDTTKKFSITHIYGLDAEEANHTLLFYNYDKVLRQPFAKRPAYTARPDSLLTPFAMLNTKGTGGWTYTNVDSTANINAMRYVMVVITFTRDQHKAQFGELVIYGKYLYDTVAVRSSIRPHLWTAALPLMKTPEFTFGKRIGSTLFTFPGLRTLAHDGIVNCFTAENYYDTANRLGVPGKYRFWNNAVGDYSIARLKAHVAGGKEILMTTAFGNAYNADGSHFSGGYHYDRWNMDNPGQEPEDPQQYKRSGDFAYNYAAKFGSVPVPAASTKWLDDAGAPNGLNLQKDFQFGNETEGNGASYAADFFKTSVDYDGHGGTVGVSGRTGIHNADPGARLMMAGLVDPDLEKIKCFAFLSAIMRPDGIFPAQVIPVHKYFSTRDVGRGNTFGWDAQIGMRAEAPERVYNMGVIRYFNHFARSVYAYVDTAVRIYQTEQGVANTFHSAASEAEAASGNTMYAARHIGNYDSLQAKAIDQTKYKVMICFTPIARYTEYNMTNQYPYNINYARPIFQSFGKIAGFDAGLEASAVWPDYNFQATFWDHLTNFYADSIIEDGSSTGVWQLRLRGIYRPDSIRQVVFADAGSNGLLAGRTIKLNATGAVHEIVPSFNNMEGRLTALTASGGNVIRTVTYIPTIYEAVEQPGNAAGAATRRAKAAVQ